MMAVVNSLSTHLHGLWARLRHRTQNSVIALTVAALLPLNASAQGPSDHFRDKTVTHIVGSDTGGGYDRFVRTLAPFLERELGARRVMVQNLPTAAGVPALDDLYRRPPDGLTLMTMNTGLLMSQIGGLDHMETDLGRLSWIGKASSETRVMLVSPEAGVSEFADLQVPGEPLRFASSRFGSAAYVQLELLRNAYDLNIRIIPGFGGAEAEAALLKGEVEGLLVSESNAPPLIAAGDAIPLLVFGQPFSPELRDVPGWRDVAASPEQTLVSQQIERLTQLGRLVATSPDTPEPVLAELRRAFVAVMETPEFQARALQNALEIDFSEGEAVAQTVREFLEADSHFKTLLEDALQN